MTNGWGGSELQALGMRASEQTQQFHDQAMTAGGEALRVSYDALPRRSRRSQAIIVAVAVAIVVGIAGLVVIAL